MIVEMQPLLRRSEAEQAFPEDMSLLWPISLRVGPHYKHFGASVSAESTLGTRADEGFAVVLHW